MSKELEENVISTNSSFSVAPIHDVGELDDNDLFNVTNPAILEKLNTFVKSIGDRPYVNPNTALARLRNKLQIVGLAIGLQPIVGESGSVEIPLTRWGGTFDPYTNTVDDNVKRFRLNGKGLKLVIDYMKMENGRYAVDACVEDSE